jgi:hypothetical protein
MIDEDRIARLEARVELLQEELVTLAIRYARHRHINVYRAGSTLHEAPKVLIDDSPEGEP